MNNLYESLNSHIPTIYKIKNKVIICSHCENDTFKKSSALLNTAGMSLLGLDWANKNAITLICSNCSHIQWYLNIEK
jgi:predicted nucleic-acid-binding Zn-ribbon protein